MRHLHPRRSDDPVGRPAARRQCRAASEVARGDGAAVPRLPGGGRRKRCDLLGRIDFTLDELRYEYPHEPVPAGWAPRAGSSIWSMAEARRPLSGRLAARSWRRCCDEEFALIRKLQLRLLFPDRPRHRRALRAAQDPPILCQGRGSAANSARLLPARHHRGRPGRAQSAVLPLPVRGARRAARHRRRFRA